MRGHYRLAYEKAEAGAVLVVLAHALCDKLAKEVLKYFFGYPAACVAHPDLDKVALNCPNLPYFPIVYYGIMKAGAVVVPLCVLFTAREIEYQLRDSDAKAVFVFEGTEELQMGKHTKEGFDRVETCEHLIVLTKDPAGASPIESHKTLGQTIFPQPDTFDMYPTDPHDTCAILYTSGTTGQPKGAELTHFNLWSNSVTTYSSHLPNIDFTDGVDVCIHLNGLTGRVE